VIFTFVAVELINMFCVISAYCSSVVEWNAPTFLAV